jgi:hypothetical protein
MEAQLEALREKLAAAETRAAVAEAVAAERDRIIQAQAQTLRMLEPNGGSPDTSSKKVEETSSAIREAPKRRWWNR